jgi:TolB-like protein
LLPGAAYATTHDPTMTRSVPRCLRFACDFIEYRMGIGYPVPMILVFGPFALDMDRAELRRDGQPVALEPKAYALLCLLAGNTDRVLGKDEMIGTVWSGRFVSDAAVSTVLKQVRKALGDDGEAQRYVLTVRGRGHRFVAPVMIQSSGRVMGQEPDPAPADPGGGPGQRPTIAVLRFAHSGLTDSATTLADAIPAEIISSLARLRWLRVIARESTFRFRGDSVDLAGLRSVLGAGYCLSGRVEMIAGRLRVEVDLVETRGGTLVWSEHFERSLDDVHGIRQDIVTAVTAALDLQIPLAEAALARTRPVERLDAWAAYHLGLSHMYRFNAHDNAVASSLFTRATVLDPGFATAFAALSFTRFQDVSMGYARDPNDALSASRAAAERSIALDPLDPYANFAMGRVHILTGRPDDGTVWLDRSVALSPNYSKGHYARGYVDVLCSRTSEARAGIRMAEGLSPLDPMIAPMYWMRAASEAIDGNFSAAADWATRASRMAPSHVGGLYMAILTSNLSGRTADAMHWRTLLHEQKPDASIGAWFKVMPFTDAGLRHTFTMVLREAGVPD